MSSAPASVGGSGEERAGLRARMMRGSAVWGVTYFLMQVLRIGTQPVLAYLLSPAIFGVMQFSQLVPKAVSMFGEVGVKSALVQNERRDERFINTAWTMQVLRGFAIALIATGLAGPAAVFYEEPMLALVIPVLSITSVLNGFESTRAAVLNRQLKEIPRAALELGTVVVTRGTMIVWAMLSPSVWALVAGGIAGAVVLVVCSHTVIPGDRNRLAWDPSAARSIWRFGGWVLLGTAIAFVSMQFDKLVLPKIVESGGQGEGAEGAGGSVGGSVGGVVGVGVGAFGLLGIYGIAMQFARIPQELVNVIATKIVFPAVAIVHRDDAGSSERSLVKARGVLAAVALPACLGAVYVSPWFFEYLYDDRYADAVWIAPLGSIAVWGAVLNASANRALLAMGQSRPLATSAAVKAAVGAVCAIGGYQLYGLAGFVLGVAAGVYAEHVYDLFTLRRNGVRLIGHDLLSTGVFLALAAMGAWGHRLLGGSVWVQVAIQALVMGGLALWCYKRVLPVVRGRA